MNSNTFRICMLLQALAVHHITAVEVENHSDLGDEKKSDHEVRAKVPPLVFLVYTMPTGLYNIRYVDLTVAKTANSSIPFHEELAYIALLCPTPIPPEGADTFVIRDVIRKFDPDTDYHMCERYLKPIVTQGFYLDPSYYIGFEYERANREDDDLKSSVDSVNTDEELDDPYTEYMDKLEIYEGSMEKDYHLSIDYNFKLMMPKRGAHFVFAQLHSNNYNEKCQDMELGIEIFKNKITNFDENIFNQFATEHPDFSWYQLIPMQDFKGIYSIAATCTYMNHILLHNHVIEGALRQLELLIRDIADIIGYVRISSGVWKKTLDNLTSNSDEKVSPLSIPTILWKAITYIDLEQREFSILMVIHNQKTRRICNHERIGKEWGWPEISGNDNGDSKHNDEEEIGTMYYCLVDETVVDELSIPISVPSDDTKLPHFNLRDFTVHVNVLNRIRQLKELQRYRRPTKVNF